ncbi:MAG: alpha/beta hydrolase [Syntrophales bacterium]|nr:alpha/beta hydrolase [Syntrophales bacterium]
MKQIPQGQIVSPAAQDHFVRVGDVNFHYLEYPGEGEDVFLLHGFASSTYTWEGVVSDLQERGCHVWAMDMKGFGWSDKPEGAKYDPITLMEEVNRWMEVMGLDNVTFVGNSLGGAVAVLMALEHPERVGRLVLIDAAGYPIEKPLIIKMTGMPFARGIAKLFFGRWAVRWNLKEVFYHTDRVTKEKVEAYYERMRTQGALNAQISVVRALDFRVFEGYTKRIPEIQAKTLIIWGRDDAWIPLESGLRFRKELAHSTLVVIPECGHIPQEEYPEMTARLIGDFVEGKAIGDSPGVR